MTEVRAAPPAGSTAAHRRGGVLDSPGNTAADVMPKTGTSNEKDATVEAGWRHSSRPRARKPDTVAAQATRTPAPGALPAEGAQGVVVPGGILQQEKTASRGRTSSRAHWISSMWGCDGSTGQTWSWRL
ncbi:hypothetical protein GCM10020295_53220 [Streptomyces cinereospinus]